MFSNRVPELIQREDRRATIFVALELKGGAEQALALLAELRCLCLQKEVDFALGQNRRSQNGHEGKAT
jgi:hypothetical protein